MTFKPLTALRRDMLIAELEELQLAPECGGSLLDRMIETRITTIRTILREGGEDVRTDE